MGRGNKISGIWDRNFNFTPQKQLCLLINIYPLMSTNLFRGQKQGLKSTKEKESAALMNQDPITLRV